VLRQLHNDPDRDLANELSSGSKADFDKVYARYAPLLLGYIARITSDNAMAERSLQQVFMEIWQSRKAYEPARERLFTWMCRIAKKVTLAVGPAAKKVSGEIVNSFAHVYINDDQAQVTYTPPAGNKVQLYELYNSVIDLMHYGGVNVAQAGSMLNTGEDKIRIMLRNAIKTLKDDQ
jgi:Sigma-70 region 2